MDLDGPEAGVSFCGTDALGDDPMMDVMTLKLAAREVTGKNVKKLRRQGVTPVHIYGGNGGSESLQVESLVLRRILPKVGRNVPLSVEVEGKKGGSVCLVREVQWDPVTDEVLHVDFMRVDVSRRIHADVPIILVGEAPAVRENGTLIQPIRAVAVESLPMEIPPSIEVDVSGLDNFEKAVYVRDITLEGDVTIITDLDAMIARVEPPRVAEEVEAPPVEEVAEEEASEEASAEDAPR